MPPPKQLIKGFLNLVLPEHAKAHSDLITDAIAMYGFGWDAMLAVAKALSQPMYLGLDRFAQEIVIDLADAENSSQAQPTPYRRKLKFMITPNYDSIDLDILLFETSFGTNNKLSMTSLRSIILGLYQNVQSSNNIADFKSITKARIKNFFYGKFTTRTLSIAQDNNSADKGVM